VATLKDISAEVGLSVATVSRALNGFPEVNDQTRQRVQSIADRLGYRPNRTAQRLVTGRSGMVGMIAKIRPDMSADQTFFEILTGLTAALAARDVDLVLAVDQGDDQVAPYKRMLERDILDGFILNAPRPDDPRVAFLTGQNVPFVMHGQSARHVSYPFYGIDNAAVSADAVALLSDLGHRRIGLINGAMRYAFARDRLDGFTAAMQTRNLTVPDAFIAEEAETEGHGYTLALPMLSGRLGPRPTGLICTTTLVASGVLKAARHLDLSVPGDLSVIAHDDALPNLSATDLDPALTVTRSPLRDACIPLANLLIDHIRGGSANDLQTLVRAELLVRASTGPVPKEGQEPWQ